MNDRPIHVSRIDTITDSQLFYAGMKTWLRDPAGEGAAPLGLLAEATRTRGLGDFWGRRARGARRGRSDDRAGPQHLGLRRVPGGGGGSGRPGHPFDGSPTRDGGSVVSSNGILHDELLTRLSGISPTG